MIFKRMRKPQPPRYENYQKLIIKLALTHSRASSLDYDDLIGEGNLCFVEASRVYDPSLGCCFSTMLYKYVNQHFWNLRNPKRRHNTPTECIDDLFGLNTGQDVEQEAAFRQSLERLSSDARMVLSVIFNTPMDLIETLREDVTERLAKNPVAWGSNKVTFKALQRYFLFKGWSPPRICKVRVEVKNALKAI